MAKFLLLLGVSGVGKTAVINELRQLDPRFVYVSPDITRPLRPGETDKVTIQPSEMDANIAAGKYLVVNHLYRGLRYGTPKQLIIDSLNQQCFPVLDWPVFRLDVLETAFPNQLVTVYLSPPSLNELYQRLALDCRDSGGERWIQGKAELQAYWEGAFNDRIHHHIVSHSPPDQLARLLYDVLLPSLDSTDKSMARS